MIHNPNCDGDKCRSETGEVRVMPYGGGGNLILCRACWENELRYRRERNPHVSEPYDLPTWESATERKRLEADRAESEVRQEMFGETKGN